MKVILIDTILKPIDNIETIYNNCLDNLGKTKIADRIFDVFTLENAFEY